MSLFTRIAILVITFFSSGIVAAQNVLVRLSGTVCDMDSNPVEYIAVSFSAADSLPPIGTLTGRDGGFSCDLYQGQYLVSLIYLGKKLYSAPLKVSADTQLDTLWVDLPVFATDEVTVRGNRIVREADRFILHLDNSPLVVGRDAQEILQLVPGIIVSQRGGISIYGRGGTRVIVNERPLRETGEDLMNYLRNIKAEDVQRIEVIPFAGSEYDASMGGGVIKLTLKKKRENGLDGSVSMRYQQALSSGKYWSTEPSFNIKYRLNKFNVYTTVSYSRSNRTSEVSEDNLFKTGSRISQSSQGLRKDTSDYWQFVVGGTYDISDRQSFGLEVNYTSNRRDNTHNNFTKQTDPQSGVTEVRSLYLGAAATDKVGVAGNYFWTLDDRGSLLKLLLDYNYRKVGDNTNYSSIFSGQQNYDTVYRSSYFTTNHLYSVSVDFDLPLSERSKLSTGAKYNYNLMDNTTDYAYDRGGWHEIGNLSSMNRYAENIGALYVKYTTRFKNNMSIGVGLRGEYTYAEPTTNQVNHIPNQNYFGLFPNINIMLPLVKSMKHILILNYGRKIRRPNFSDLNPFRTPMNEYAYIEGNPGLRPSYFNDLSLTWVFNQKYTLAGGMTLINDAIAQITTVDSQDPDIIIYRKENIQNNRNYFVNLSLPINFFKWWKMNTSLTYINVNTEVAGIKRHKNMFLGNMNHIFTLRDKWYIDLSLFYRSPALSGNYISNHTYRVDLALKRSFMKNRLVCSVGINDLFESQRLRIMVDDPTYYRQTFVMQNYRTLSLLVRYNFKVGKAVKSKVIQSGAEDEKTRL
ncbi:outer membrane beta-barrel family protein [uncultured Rikenella sp.]|uniref:outer membrane beta-barrel family protein n=1 Tax=uncultured Rikenella sp. TaxID=368003 RepID=UPI00272A120D|nr:outer membrane beta-barrel family protein [uncultured Rikenella sp.]